MKTAATNLDVAVNVRAEMARAGVSQVQMAEALGLSQYAVSHRLRGLTPWSALQIAVAAGLLGVPISQIIPDQAFPEAGAA